jgi:small-conductance mechanosensitive channel
MWPDVVIPLAVFAAGLIATLWLRQAAYSALIRWASKTKWQGDDILVQATRLPSIFWCLIISAALALAVSDIKSLWKNLSSDGLWTLLVLSLTLYGFNLANQLVPLYGERFKAPQRAIAISRNIIFAIISIIAVLVLLDIWGAPTSAIIFIILLVIVVVILGFRETLPNFLAAIQISARAQFRAGDYIKLETGEEGYIKEMNLTYTVIETLDKSTVLLPNRKLVQSTVVNLGHPLKKAKQPFHFFNRAHLKELTGLKAKSLKELAEILKNAPDSVVYYHTHHFLEEHHYLTPEPANDFATWVSDVLDDEVLGERLASIDAFEFPNLAALRERIVNVIEEHLTSQPEIRQVPEGKEFHFIKSVSVVLPTPYVATDLREFVETLRKLSLGSLYYHIFESRLRLGKASNDFSAWMEDSMGEPELAEKIARFDPYSYTLEGTRSLLIQLIEKHIK